MRATIPRLSGAFLHFVYHVDVANKLLQVAALPCAKAVQHYIRSGVEPFTGAGSGGMKINRRTSVNYLTLRYAVTIVARHGEETQAYPKGP